IAGDVHFAQSNTGDPLLITNNVSIVDDYLVLGVFHRGVGVFVDTTNMKQFVVQAGVKHDNSGRLVFAAYDANGDMIPWDWDVLQSEADSTLSGYGGTVVRTGADVLQSTHVSVSDAVKKVRVMITGGSKPLFIKSFSIVAADDSGAPQV